MRRIHALALLCLLSACGSGKKDEKKAGTKHQTTTIKQPPAPAPAEDKDEPVALTKTYSGPALTLVHPHRDSLGWINLPAADSAALFSALRLEGRVAPAETGWAEGTARTGKFVSCVERAPRGAPEQKQVGCVLSLNYQQGRLLPQRNPSAVDTTRVAAVAPYAGPNLTISPAGELTVTLLGRDARRLFWALEAVPIGEENGLEVRRSEQLTCAHQRNDRVAPDQRYQCVLTLDLQGEARAAGGTPRWQ